MLSGWKAAVGGQGGSWLERDVGLIPREDTTEGMAVEFSVQRIPETAQSEDRGQIWFLQRSPWRGCSGWGWSWSCSLPCPLPPRMVSDTQWKDDLHLLGDFCGGEGVRA